MIKISNIKLMKKFNLWMSAAILCSSLMMTSCHDSFGVDDHPTKEPETASAEDPGKWWIDESHMDKSVKLSDNFYMYCNGTWWKNTTIDPTYHITTRFDDVNSSFSDKVNSLTDDNFAIYKSHLEWADPSSAAAASAQKLYDEVLAQSGLTAATTAEDVLRALGKMFTLGVAPVLWLEPFCHNDKICLFSYFNTDIFTELSDDQGSAYQSAKAPSLQRLLNDNPEMLSHFVPVSGKSGTRGLSAEWSFFKYILEGMGIDPECVYVSEDYQSFTGQAPQSKDEVAERIRKQWQDALEQNSVELLKRTAMNSLKTDYGFISQKTREECELPPSLNQLDYVMTEKYLPYQISKMVADQLVPAGLKEEYLRYCKELKDVFTQRIKDNDWMSDGSKQNALEKLDAMPFNVAYPDHWITVGLPDFSKSQSLLEDIYTIRKARLNLLKAIIGKGRAEESFTVVAMDKEGHLGIENAFYYNNLNCMNILPYTILPPYYDPTQSLAINYEGLSTVGHEITHGFDNEGALFDKHGDYTPTGIWASAADKAEFDRRTELLVKCYASYDVLPDELPGVKAEGRVTLAENIADLGGAEIAYQAYLNRLNADGYTGDRLKLMKQRFFLALGDKWRAKYGEVYVYYIAFGKANPHGPDGHSMNKERVNGVVANMNGWYEAFDIQDGALYRKPADRIKIW